MALKETIVTTLTLNSSKFSKGMNSSRIAAAGMGIAIVALASKVSDLVSQTALLEDEQIKNPRRVGVTA